ncbi:hypothetical protein BDW02DRAFT_597727 [Decorospora gaudefroyi]|uniref:BTB domain-containing protein n=1 Tax=Decorospora gaudefroyi TaxID=184978 RepID=A0A6A5KAR6_9PLEO|nr:hypothetical protein BDW02DRAFT_597727 [Decorospora gaudefroyi]
MATSMADLADAVPYGLGDAMCEGIAVIEIGPRHKKYCVHRALLTHHSEYFCKALNGPWKEAQEGRIAIEDIGTEEFNIFIHWIYTQTFPELHDIEAWDRILGNSDLPHSGRDI